MKRQNQKMPHQKRLKMSKFGLKNKYHTNAFEGWYTRLLSDEGDINIAVIFAITLYDKDPHAFIQVFNGVKQVNAYHRFDIEDFHYENGTIHIQENQLSLKHLALNLPSMVVDVRFEKLTENPVKSAMGVLRHLPLQCFQEVNVLSATAQGTINNAPFKGSNYIEKTYGKQFPKQWFWLQADRFDKPVQLSLAGGHVPTFKLKPFGFFLLINTPDKCYRFATYTLASFKHKTIAGKHHITIKRWPYTVKLIITPGTFTTLKGPGEKAEMNKDVPESLNTQVQLTLFKRHEVILATNSDFAGFEWAFNDS